MNFWQALAPFRIERPHVYAAISTTDKFFQPPLVPPNPDIIDEFFSSDCLVDWPRHPGLWDYSKEGKIDSGLQTPADRRTFERLGLHSVWVRAACSSISYFPSLPFPCRGRNESLSQRLASVIPQYRPGFHSCRGTVLWHHFPLSLLWTCSLPVRNGSLMTMSRRFGQLLELVRWCLFNSL